METRVAREQKLIMTVQLRRELMFEQKGRCAICHVEEWKLKKRLHAHRIKKGRDGGKYEKGNVVLLCPKCHNKTERGL